MNPFNENHATTTAEDDRRGRSGSIGDIGKGANPSPTWRCRWLGSSTWRDRELDADGDLGIEDGAGRITLPI
jgi:hypothetical protein